MKPWADPQHDTHRVGEGQGVRLNYSDMEASSLSVFQGSRLIRAGGQKGCRTLFQVEWPLSGPCSIQPLLLFCLTWLSMSCVWWRQLYLKVYTRQGWTRLEGVQGCPLRSHRSLGKLSVGQAPSQSLFPTQRPGRFFKELLFL